MPRAAIDAEQIYTAVAGGGSHQGARWYAGLMEALESLARMPNRGEPLPQYSEGDSTVRKLLYGRRRHAYRIYYRVTGDVVEVLHIRHGARRPPEREEVR